MANEAKPLFRPGQEVTALTTADVTGKTFVKITATRDATTGLVKVGPGTAGSNAFGVASADIASGATGSILRGGLVFVTAGGSITAGARVEVGANGKAVAFSSGIAVGTACETGSSDVDCLIALDL